MNMLFIGATLALLGKVIVVLVVLHMHMTFVIEKKIDRKVILTYQQERTLTYIGLIFLIVGYFLEMVYFGFVPALNPCGEYACAALLIQTF